MAFNLFPFTNLHNLNTDWILKTIQEAKAAVEESLAAVRTALADAVLYTSQSKDTSSRRVACTNIHAVSYDTTVISPEDKAQARTNIGAAAAADVTSLGSAVDDLTTAMQTTVRFTEQSLSDISKAQARANIGAVSAAEIPSAANAVLYTEQSLTSGQQTQARTNIGAAASSAIPDVTDVLRYSSQSLTSGQQSQARTNIGAAASSAIPDVTDVLRYSSQSLTSGQQSQARSNIGAAYDSDVSDLQLTEVYNLTIEETAADTFSITGGNLSDAQLAQSHGAPVIINLITINDGLLRGLADFTDDNNGDIKATLVNMYGPGLANSTGYRVIITSSGGSDVLTCTQFFYSDVPGCGILDSGKLLKVNSTGIPEWTSSPNVITDSSSTTPTIASAQDDTIYKFTQDLTSLSLTAGTGSYMICFHAGSTATTTSFPVSILGLDDFVPETKTYYEISIMDGRAVWMGWPDPAL